MILDRDTGFRVCVSNVFILLRKEYSVKHVQVYLYADKLDKKKKME